MSRCRCIDDPPIFRCPCGGERFITASGLCCFRCGARIVVSGSLDRLRKSYPEKVIHCQDVTKVKF
jgi:hypothetical protein